MAIEAIELEPVAEGRVVPDLAVIDGDAQVIVLQPDSSSPVEREEEFTSMVRKFSGGMYACARKIINDSSLAEDLVQEAFLSAWAKLSEYQHAGRLGAWLMQIVRNKSIDALRWQNRHPQIPLNPFDGTPDDQTPGIKVGFLRIGKDNNPANIYDEERIEDKLETALTELTAKEREVIELYINGYKAQDVADKLGISPITARTRVCRARQKIGRLLEQIG